MKIEINLDQILMTVAGNIEMPVAKTELKADMTWQHTCAC